MPSFFDAGRILPCAPTPKTGERLGLRAEDWRELCRACRVIYIPNPTPPYFRGLLLAGLGAELGALRTKVQSFGPAQLEEVATRVRDQQAEEYLWLRR